MNVSSVSLKSSFVINTGESCNMASIAQHVCYVVLIVFRKSVYQDRYISSSAVQKEKKCRIASGIKSTKNVKIYYEIYVFLFESQQF